MLHGEIRINRQTIAVWSVIRQERFDDIPPDDSISSYKWHYAQQGGIECEGELRHRYGDGAAFLMAKVMSAAATEINSTMS